MGHVLPFSQRYQPHRWDDKNYVLALYARWYARKRQAAGLPDYPIRMHQDSPPRTLLEQANIALAASRCVRDLVNKP